MHHYGSYRHAFTTFYVQLRPVPLGGKNQFPIPVYSISFLHAGWPSNNAIIPPHNAFHFLFRSYHPPHGFHDFLVQPLRLFKVQSHVDFRVHLVHILPTSSRAPSKLNYYVICEYTPQDASSVPIAVSTAIQLLPNSCSKETTGPKKTLAKTVASSLPRTSCDSLYLRYLSRSTIARITLCTDPTESSRRDSWATQPWWSAQHAQSTEDEHSRSLIPPISKRSINKIIETFQCKIAFTCSRCNLQRISHTSHCTLTLVQLRNCKLKFMLLIESVLGGFQLMCWRRVSIGLSERASDEGKLHN